MKYIPGFLSRQRTKNNDAQICEDVFAWSAGQPGATRDILAEPITITRQPPNTIEAEIDPEYTARYTAKLRGRYLVSVKRARILAENGLVILPNGSYALESMYTKELLEKDPSFRSPPTDFHKERGNFFSLVAIWSKGGNYYHWLHDSLLRLYQVEQKLPADTKYIVPARLHPFQRESLSLLGIQPDHCVPLDAQEALELETLYFAPPTTNSGSDRADAAGWLRERLWNACGIANPKPSRRIYITRRNAPNRRVSNEHEVEDCLSEFGFETVACEALTFRQQIQLFSSAQVIVAAHGAGLANAWFSPGGARVVDLLEASHRGWAYVYWNLCCALGHAYWYFWNESSTVPGSDGNNPDMIVSLDRLRRTLNAMQL